MNTYGWGKLFCPYFSRVCKDVLSRYLESEGFRAAHIEPHGAVIFTRLEVFVEIGYEPESAPAYAPRVIIGFGDRTFDDELRINGIPMWYVIGEQEPAHRYTLWKFSTETELQSTLAKIRDDVLDPYARPLWERTELLEEQLERFRTEHT